MYIPPGIPEMYSVAGCVPDGICSVLTDLPNTSDIVRVISDDDGGTVIERCPCDGLGNTANVF
jgi:hypothetical protein